MNIAGPIVCTEWRLGSPKSAPDTHRELEALDAQVDKIYNLMQFGSFCTNSDGSILSINDAALALLGLERNRLVGEVIPKACFTQKSFEELAQLSASGCDNSDNYKLGLYLGEGKIRHLLCSWRTVSESASAARSHRFLITDITESGQTRVCRSSRAVDMLSRHISAHGPHHLTSDQMADLTGLTSRALGYAFHRQFGCTPIEWQRNHFLDLAHQYLTEKEVSGSIKSVARKFGFASSTSFAQFYRKRFGNNPGQTEYVRSPEHNAYAKTPVA